MRRAAAPADWPIRRHEDAEAAALEREGFGPVGQRIEKIEAPDLSGQAVYFVQAVGVNLVKIGWVLNAASFDKRFARLQTDCPYPAKLLHLAPGVSRREEQRAHKMFEKVHHHGEWFRIEGDLKRFLQLCAVDGEAATGRLRAALARKVLTSNFWGG